MVDASVTKELESVKYQLSEQRMANEELISERRNLMDLVENLEEQAKESSRQVEKAMNKVSILERENEEKTSEMEDIRERITKVAELFERADAGAPAGPVARPGGTAAGFQLVPRETQQTHIVFGTDAPRHADRDRYGLILLSTALGGGMSSRLFQRVRFSESDCRGTAFRLTWAMGHVFPNVLSPTGLFLGTREAAFLESRSFAEAAGPCMVETVNWSRRPRSVLAPFEGSIPFTPPLPLPLLPLPPPPPPLLLVLLLLLLLLL